MYMRLYDIINIIHIYKYYLILQYNKRNSNSNSNNNNNKSNQKY